MTRQIRRTPTHDHRHTRVAARSRQEQPCVLRVRLVVHFETYGEPREGDGLGEKGEDVSVAEVVGGDGDDHGEGEGTGPRWNGEELGVDGGAVSEGLDDAWGEVC